MLTQLKEVLKQCAPGLTAGYRIFHSYWTGRRWIGKGMNAFREIHRLDVWNDSESKSGSGSSLRATEALRAELPALLDRLNVASILDVPCGDFHWMSVTDVGARRYVGAELVAELVADLRRQYESIDRVFICADVSIDDLPSADLVLCRDCLVHFSYADIRKALANLRRTGAKYLATTTYPSRTFNVDCPTGHWRSLNLQLAPFHFPAPVELIWDDVVTASGQGDKSLGVWRMEELPIGVAGEGALDPSSQ
jgi:hypothetical protein